MAILGQPTTTPDAQATAELTFDLSGIPSSRAADGAFVLGDPDAPITVVEFFDWACIHCQQYQPAIEQFIETYVRTGLARFEVRIFPTQGGERTDYASRIAECAEDQQMGSFWSLYSQLYELAEAGAFTDEFVEPILDTTDLDTEKLISCANSDDTHQVDVDMPLGFANGVSGTPTLRVRYGTLDEAGELEVIELDGRRYNSGAVLFEVLAEVVEAANE